MKNRKTVLHIQQKSQSKFGRILILTGARQTGKTTLVKKAFLLSNDEKIQYFDDKTIAIHTAMFLG